MGIPIVSQSRQRHTYVLSRNPQAVGWVRELAPRYRECAQGQGDQLGASVGAGDEGVGSGGISVNIIEKARGRRSGPVPRQSCNSTDYHLLFTAQQQHGHVVAEDAACIGTDPRDPRL